MSFNKKYDKYITGIISGFALPFMIGSLIFIFSSGHHTVHSFLARIAESDIITHSISLCVFPNIFLFLLYDRFDMLHSSRGVLAVTIFWAVLVFGIKFIR
jgi:hypothetical protein